MRDVIPRWLKSLLVPSWNAAYRFARFAYDVQEAITHRRFKRCTVCGRNRLMLYRRRIIPRRLEELWGISPRQAEAFARKESCHCMGCGANLRCRRIARVILDVYTVGKPPDPARSIVDWVERAEIRPLRIAEINRIAGLHERLARLPGFVGSDYHPGAAPGDLVHGTRSEDLTNLTYPDASLDLVLTSETLEHVPDLGAALGEIRRVLAPGGRHLFTVPVLPGTSSTFRRAVLHPDGTIEDRAARISHPGGDWGYPVFTEFGADLPDLLRHAGFEVEVVFGPVRDDDLAQVYVCRRAE